MSQRFAAKLTSRGVVNVSGPDSLRFLQGLVTCDVHKICGPDEPFVSPAAFLNGRGRLLFGTLLIRRADEYLIDAPHDRVPDLLKHLKKYKLRAKVAFEEVSDSYDIWSIINSDCDYSQRFATHGFIFDDPRLSALGKRAIVERGFQPDGLDVKQEDAFTQLRILNGVPEDSDFANTPLPLDLAYHLLNGVSFTKGCYLGQELTARSHFTGVLRKRITPIAISDTSNAGGVGISDDDRLRLHVGTELFVDGKAKAVGVVSSAVRNVGLAVVRLSDVFGPSANGILTTKDGRIATAWRAGWWTDVSRDDA